MAGHHKASHVGCPTARRGRRVQRASNGTPRSSGKRHRHYSDTGLGWVQRSTRINATLAPQDEMVLSACLHVTPLGDVREVSALRGELRNHVAGLVELPPPEYTLHRVGQEAGIGPQVVPFLLAISECLGQDVRSAERRDAAGTRGCHLQDLLVESLRAMARISLLAAAIKDRNEAKRRTFPTSSALLRQTS